VEGEYVPRPQGTVLYVKLPPDVVEAAGDAALGTHASSEDAEAAPETRQDAAVVALLLERLDAKDTALLAATERAVKAETALDAAQAAEKDLRARLEAAEAERDRLRAKRWYDPRTW